MFFGTGVAYVDRCRDGSRATSGVTAITGIVSTVVKQGRGIETLNALVSKDDKFCKLSLERVVFAKSPRPLWMVNCGTDCEIVGIERGRVVRTYSFAESQGCSPSSNTKASHGRSGSFGSSIHYGGEDNYANFR